MSYGQLPITTGRVLPINIQKIYIYKFLPSNVYMFLICVFFISCEKLSNRTMSVFVCAYMICAYLFEARVRIIRYSYMYCTNTRIIEYTYITRIITRVIRVSYAYCMLRYMRAVLYMKILLDRIRS